MSVESLIMRAGLLFCFGAVTSRERAALPRLQTEERFVFKAFNV